MSPRPDIFLDEAEMRALLERPLNAVLTTLDRDGWPHPTAMWFISDEAGVRMWTYRKSQKAVNISRDRRAAFLVEDGIRYDELRGVLIRGRAEVIEEFDVIRDIGIALYRRYSEPSTGIPVDQGPIVEIERQAHKRIGLRIPFDRVTSWDHRKL